MWRFVRNCLIFLLLTVSLLLVGEPIVRRVSNPYSVQREAVGRFGRDTRTLVLGSSQTYYGIIADSLPNALSLANVSQNFEYDYRMLSHYGPSMPELRTIILSVCYFSFFDPPFAQESKFSMENYYKIYHDLDKYPDISLQNLELVNFASYSGKLKNLVTGKKGPQTTPKGFGLDYDDKSRVPNFDYYTRRMAANSAKMDEGHEQHNRAWFERLMNLAAERRLRVILISPPLAAVYRQAFDPAQKARTQALIKYYQGKYGFEYYDFSASPLFTDSLDYRDGSHLDRSGAEKLTNLMRPILESH